MQQQQLSLTTAVQLQNNQYKRYLPAAATTLARRHYLSGINYLFAHPHTSTSERLYIAHSRRSESDAHSKASILSRQGRRPPWKREQHARGRRGAEPAGSSSSSSSVSISQQRTRGRGPGKPAACDCDDEAWGGRTGVLEESKKRRAFLRARGTVESIPPPDACTCGCIGSQSGETPQPETTDHSHHWMVVCVTA